ncbi:2-amino-4-hydroxy-6-hydroxymethyldihydropteridine diphosphokinase [Oscillatoria amoena NRMC-F 0135]|nr:2-amino-4-hydroxy-6-hydroxymethyldihydropteridine diphosphokinase [Oscillatoria laete-virens]MDL5048385.1 2-amino-4-hydroxy-6-hydroxymethyldihydropteridine diphosphokinase [Oscillatoria amoena NRMC-F 0135]MDL5054250.1 2-amino-4-hydroxy-6-hydroxymethyldihydropteridine diphosphokinase [Oscillatoria laete-virens NRMC-F 0139]
MNIPVGIALGSNMGNSVQNVRQALNWLASLACDGAIFPSSLFESTPVDCAPGTPLFVNAVCEIHLPSGADPLILLRKLQCYEAEHGRPAEHGINQPRTIDLDIIYFGDVRSNLPELIIPHPRATLRQFVLEPLAEIRPKLILPGQKDSVAELLAGLPDKDPRFKKILQP